jgi:DNA-binding transcriptional ArsR family regulator
MLSILCSIERNQFCGCFKLFSLVSFFVFKSTLVGNGECMTAKNLYVNYLIQIKSVPVAEMLSKASAGCVALLGEIAVAEVQGRPLTVSQIMAMIHLASPGTIHRRLESLRQKGLIDLVYRNGNRRTKYIVPTAAADAYFEKMGDVLVKTLSNARKPHKVRVDAGELALAA